MRLGARALTLAWAALVGIAVQTVYLLVLLVAGRRQPRAPARAFPNLVVLVPAHDEEVVVPSALESLLAAEYPSESREIVVIADNCADDTAGAARRYGVTVWNRTDPRNRGKGQALAWALARVQEERPATAGVVVVDADCKVSSNLLGTLGAWIATGADAVQADYRISNAHTSPTAALRFAGFALFNSVRPRGKESLGLSCGLLGTGMAFPLRTLASLPWDAFSVGEDREYHARLVAAGGRARFAADATVFSEAPATESAAAIQQTRWETGNVQLAYQWAPRLFRDGLARRDHQRLHAAFEFLLPPLSLLVAPVLGVFASASLVRERRLQLASMLVGMAQCGYVFGGLVTVGAPRHVYTALITAPGLVYRKLLQYLRILTGGGASTWQRTTRNERQSA